jgi:hypothetical protein
VDGRPLGADLVRALLEAVGRAMRGCHGVGLTVWPLERTAAGLTQHEPDGEHVLGIGSAAELDHHQRDLEIGPLIEAGRKESIVLSDDLAVDDRYPQLHEPAARLLARAGDPDARLGAVATPGSWTDAGPLVLTAYLDHPPDVDDLAVLDRYEPMLAAAVGMVEFCAGETVRADQMVDMLRYRRVIEQAKGAIMAAEACGAEQAFELLARTSQHANVKVRDLSVALVSLAAGLAVGPPAAPPGRPEVSADVADGVPGGLGPLPDRIDPATEKTARLLWDALRRRSRAR